MSADTGHRAPTVTAVTALPTDVEVDRAGVLVVGTAPGAGADTAGDGPDDAGQGPVVVSPEALPGDAVAEITAALAALGATGAAEQTHRLVVASLPYASVLAVGLGARGDGWSAETLRRAAGAAARSLDHRVPAVVTTLSLLDPAATVEGLLLGAYRFTDFRSPKTAPTTPGLQEVTVLVADTDTSSEAVATGVDVAVAVATARDLVNTPPSHLHPAAFAERAAALGAAVGLEVEVLDDAALLEGGYGGVVGVGQGSSRPPRLVRLVYRGTDGSHPTVALVGKGITFDTGGISIKPAANMHHMTSDMGGAAAVIATVVLAARRGLPLTVTATVPMAENMPSSTAQRPGDVLTQYGGTTVEVLNTDAEGRLVLADAIVRACEDTPDYLVETSTLTGAQIVALGSRTPGVMGSDAFRDRVARLSREVGENGWAMPLPDELGDDLKSPVADLANVSGTRNAGMLVAGTFLREFVADGVQWAHIDIAGPSYNTGKPWGYTGKGGTGVPTRTLFAVLTDIAAHG